jgi:peptide/nickel transport system substrate-binding protein
MQKLFNLLVLTFLLLFFSACKEKQIPLQEISLKPQYGGNVIVGISSDVDVLNPLFSQDIISGTINDLIFAALNYSEFDLERGELVYYPNLTKSWEIAKDHKSIKYSLKTHLKWSDGKSFTANDVKFSYYLYTHPEVGSVRYDIASYFIAEGKDKVEIDSAVKVENDSTVIFYFSRNVNDPLFVTGLPILPKHIFEKIKLKELFVSDINQNPIGVGPFKLEKWDKQQQIVLVRNDSVNYDKIPYLNKLTFKILPDYNNRVNQLKSGEIDLVQNLRPEDANGIKKDFKNLRVETISGRDYDYIGWNSIDHTLYFNSDRKSIMPHKLFGSVKVRQALTYAINRKEILEGFFGEFGNVAVTLVSSIFKTRSNTNLLPYEYDPSMARELLAKEGWKDSNGDKVIDKNGMPFKFKLTIPAGKPQREYAATVIKNNLLAVGIYVEVEVVEPSVFFENMFGKKYEAWIAGWTIPLDLDFEAFWGSDLEKNFFNVTSYQNKEIDEIFAKLKHINEPESNRMLLYKFQEIIHRDQPVTFLYWFDNLVGYNLRLRNLKLNPIAFTNRAWDWFVTDGK